ncbi:CGNR zinc finger domain-containing protein [Spirillospora sp. NPDC049652]
MQFNTYTAAGAIVAAELVNEPSGSAAWMSDLLERYEIYRPSLDQAGAAELRAWAEGLRLAFETTGAEQAAAVDALFVAADCRPRLVSHDGLPYHLHYAPLDAKVTTRVKALTTAGLAQVIADGAAGRLGSCTREGCDIVFVDTSRNGRRAFCSVRCANAVNVRRHRARRRYGDPTPANGM